MHGFALLVLLFSQAAVSEHLALGNPSEAVAPSGDAHEPRQNALFVKPEYCLSYNEPLGTPNWVAWRCSKGWLGAEERSNNFREDDAIPAHWFRATPKHYVATGFDRGHLCPAGDRGKTSEAMSQTFFMSNMIPQSPKLNRGPWKYLESHCRDLVNSGHELYITAGPCGVGGFGSKGYRERLGDDFKGERIIVPSACWKVAVILQAPKDEANHAQTAASRVIEETKIIAVIMPNSNDVAPWTDYRTTVRAIEEITGYDFLREVAKPIQDAIEVVISDEE